MTMTEERTVVELPAFEGREVTAAAVKITKAGDGLSDALKVTPKALHHGEEVTYLLRGRVAQVNHKEVGKEATYTRVHVIEAVDITEVNGEEFAAKLDENRARVAEEMRKLKGEHTLEDGQGEICPVCGDVFDTAAELEDHAEEDHDEA